MQQKVFLIIEIYLFSIYFSLNNFNYPNKKLAIPSKLRNSRDIPAKLLRKKKKTCLGFGGCLFQSMINRIPNILAQSAFTTYKSRSVKEYGTPCIYYIKKIIQSSTYQKQHLKVYLLFIYFSFMKVHENFIQLKVILLKPVTLFILDAQHHFFFIWKTLYICKKRFWKAYSLL